MLERVDAEPRPYARLQRRLHPPGPLPSPSYLKTSVGPAMPMSSPLSAIGANAERWSGSRNNPAVIIRERDAQNFNPWAG